MYGLWSGNTSRHLTKTHVNIERTEHAVRIPFVCHRELDEVYESVIWKPVDREDFLKVPRDVRIAKCETCQAEESQIGWRLDSKS